MNNLTTPRLVLAAAMSLALGSLPAAAAPRGSVGRGLPPSRAFEDHPDLASTLFEGASKMPALRKLGGIVKDRALSEWDHVRNGPSTVEKIPVVAAAVALCAGVALAAAREPVMRDLVESAGVELFPRVARELTPSVQRLAEGLLPLDRSVTRALLSGTPSIEPVENGGVLFSLTYHF